jgi:hypothetical protein
MTTKLMAHAVDAAWGATQDALSAQLSDVARWRSSQLMTVDVSSRHVRMYFSDTLMKMLQEVRQVQALGFSCTSEVLREVKTASSFLRWAVPALVLPAWANLQGVAGTSPHCSSVATNQSCCYHTSHLQIICKSSCVVRLMA